MPSLQPNLFTRPMSFVEQCAQSLLSPEAQQDGIVSHIEFADFFAHHCKKEGLCDDTFSIEFEELDVSLQLDFILLACSDSTEDCNDFDTFGVGVNDVEEVCSSAFEYALSKGLTSTFGKFFPAAWLCLFALRFPEHINCMISSNGKSVPCTQQTSISNKATVSSN